MAQQVAARSHGPTAIVASEQDTNGRASMAGNFFELQEIKLRLLNAQVVIRNLNLQRTGPHEIPYRTRRERDGRELGYQRGYFWPISPGIFRIIWIYFQANKS